MGVHLEKESRKESFKSNSLGTTTNENNVFGNQNNMPKSGLWHLETAFEGGLQR